MSHITRMSSICFPNCLKLNFFSIFLTLGTQNQKINPADVRDLEFLFFPTTTLKTTITTQIVTNNNMQYRINFAFLHVFFFYIRVLQVAFGLDD